MFLKIQISSIYNKKKLCIFTCDMDKKEKKKDFIYLNAIEFLF